MTKQEYLDTLTKALKTNKVKEIDEIVSEYEDHFAFKIADGYSEEEVAAKLEKPEIIAAQFVYDDSASSMISKRRGGSITYENRSMFAGYCDDNAWNCALQLCHCAGRGRYWFAGIGDLHDHRAVELPHCRCR